MYENILLQAGLTDSETAIYSLLLNTGDLSAAEITAKTTFTRSSVYYVLDRLEMHGLIEKLKKDKKTVFRTEHPMKLKLFVEQRQQALRQSEHQLDAVLPDLLSQYNLVSNKQGVYMFEGKDGVIKAYEELLDDRMPIDSIEDTGEMAAFIPDYIPEFIAKRVRNKMRNRVVVPSTNAVNTTSDAELRDTRTIDVNQFPFSMDMKITSKKIVLVTFQKETAVGVIIMHPEIVKNYQLLFNFFWEAALKFSPPAQPVAASRR